MSLPDRVFLVVWWLDDLGGMEEHVTELACALRRQSVDVVVFSEMPLPPANSYGIRLRDVGIRVIAPPPSGRLAGIIGTLPLGFVRHAVRVALSFTLGALRQDPVLKEVSTGPLGYRLIRALEQECAQGGNPGVVHVHGTRFGQAWVLQWAGLKGLPCAYTEHVTISDWGGPRETGAARLIAGSGAALASVSERSRTAMRQYLPNSPTIALSSHIVHGPNARQPRPTGGPLRLACVARLQPHKGIDVLLKAFALAALPNTTLRIAGDGPLQSDLRRTAHDLGIEHQVEFLGRIPADAVARLLADSDIAILPSLTEGLPLSIVEAFAHGVPVIASEVGGIPEILRNEANGLLVPPGDPAALAAALTRLALDPAFRSLLAQGARTTWETSGFHETAVLKALSDLYQEAKHARR